MQRVDVTAWLMIGDFALAMAQAFAKEYEKSTSQTTRYGAARSITNGFVPYVIQEGIRIQRGADVPHDLLTKYLDHLAERTKKNGKKIENFTKLSYWRSVASIYRRIVQDDPTIELDIPYRPFAGTNFASKNNKAPDREAITAMLLQAAKDAFETISLVDPFLPKLDEAIARIRSDATGRSENIEGLVAEILHRYDGTIPPRVDLIQTDLSDWINRHGYLAIRRLVHPVANDLMPFFLLMASHSGWNQQPLTHLRISNCEVTTILGYRRLTIHAQKLRANSVVRRSFALTDLQLSPNEIIQFVVRWTATLRKLAPEAVKDDLWLHHVTTAGRNEYARHQVDSLAGRFLQTTVKPTNYVQRYCKQNKLKFIGLKEMRLAFAELVATATGGDPLALRELLGHKRVSTTNKNYRTPEMRRRDAEALAGAQAARERWISSRGKIDTRTIGENRDRTAATPGFICMDHFDSPLFGQRKGRMCDAYGHCPGCPLAINDPNKPYAMARYLQLHEKYEEAKVGLGKEIWKAKYANDAKCLTTRWIPAVSSPVVLASARELLLPPLPDLE